VKERYSPLRAPGDQGTQQHCGIEPIGLGSPCPAVDLQAAGIHHPAGDPLGRKAALQPEPVIAGFVADHDLHRAATTRLSLACLQATEQRHQASDVAAL